MDDKPTFQPFLFSTLLLFLGGWGGLALLLNFSVPTLWPRWGFFALLVLAGTGTTIPVSYWLNSRFSSNFSADPRVIARQSVSVGVYLALLSWLAIGRILNLSIAVWLALGLAAIEYIVRLRQASLQSDKKTENVSSQSPGG